MGCGNNKVSRDYLTSQPASTPSVKAARTGGALVAEQVLRIVGQPSQQSASHAAKVRADATRSAKAAEARPQADADRKAEKKAADKKAKEARDEEEAAGRLLLNTIYHSVQPALEETQLLPGQPEFTRILRNGVAGDIPSWARHVNANGKFVEELVDGEGSLTMSPLHIHTKVRANGTVFMQGTDRRDDKEDHFGKIEVFVPDAPSELVDALFDIVAEMLRERE